MVPNRCEDQAIKYHSRLCVCVNVCLVCHLQVASVSEELFFTCQRFWVHDYPWHLTKFGLQLQWYYIFSISLSRCFDLCKYQYLIQFLQIQNTKCLSFSRIQLTSGVVHKKFYIGNTTGSTYNSLLEFAEMGQLVIWPPMKCTVNGYGTIKVTIYTHEDEVIFFFSWRVSAFYLCRTAVNNTNRWLPGL